MNRTEFMGQLERLLWDLPDSERQDALEYYSDYFDDAGRENEDSVIQKLGSPGKVAAIIRAGYLSGPERRDSGEYTENGYRDTNISQRQQMPVRRERAHGKAEGTDGPDREERESGGRAAAFARGTEKSRRAEDGGRSSFEQAEQGETRSAEQEKMDGGQASTGGPQDVKNERTDGNGGKRGNASDARGTESAGPWGAGAAAGAQRPAQRRRGVGAWALLVIAAIFLFPLLTGIGGGLLGLLGGLFGACLALIFSGFGLVAGGIAAGVRGVFISFTSPGNGLVVLGGGLLMISLGLLLVLFFLWLAFRLLPKAVRGLVNWASRLLHHGRGPESREERQGGEQR